MKKMLRHRMALRCFMMVIGILFLSGLSEVNARPIITATLKADPETYGGPCPVTIKFEGEISVQNIDRPPLRVQYRFVRSDGALAPIETLIFEKDGSQKVETTWTLGGAPLPHYAGWEGIEIVHPQHVQSNKAGFNMRCGAEQGKKPDLVIRYFGLKEWGQCEPQSMIFTFQVTVANIGTAPSPAIADKALVQVMDQHGNGWGNGALLGEIPPGGSQTVLIPVYYLVDDPSHITGAAPHPFKAIADPLGLVDELREDNNESPKTINVDPRGLCRKVLQPTQVQPPLLRQPLKLSQVQPPTEEPTQVQPPTLQPSQVQLPPLQGVVKEDCVSFNPVTTEVKNINGDWKIVDGSHWVFSFGNKKAEADKSLEIIKHYRMNQSCFVGRPGPSFQYLLISGNAPSGSFPGEDCVSFNPVTAEVKNINGDWKIVDGSHWVFSFGNNESEARQALAIIKKYTFNRSCFVGRPGPSFEYLHK